MRRWTLARNGWRFAGIATGADRVDAEQRFFATRGVAGSAALARAPAAAPAPRDRSAETVIGVFPEPGTAR